MKRNESAEKPKLNYPMVKAVLDYFDPDLRERVIQSVHEQAERVRGREGISAPVAVDPDA